MLFIHNDVVEEILKMEDCIAAQEQAFRDLDEQHSPADVPTSFVMS